MFDKKAKLIAVVSTVVLAIAVIASCLLFGGKNGNNKSENRKVKETAVEDGSISFGGKTYVLNEDITSFLVIGLDTMEVSNEYDDHQQADFLMLFIFDNSSKKYTALHINRDTMAEVNTLAMDGSKVKSEKKQIALAHTEGDGGKMSCQNTADAVSSLLMGVKIDYYASFTMDAVAVVNDSVGGVPVEIEDDMTMVDPAFKKGETVILNGSQALKFVRARGELKDSSNAKRMVRQREYLTNLFRAIKQRTETEDGYFNGVFPKVSKSVVTNCSLTKLASMWENFSGFTNSGFPEIAGELKTGEKFMEFYPDKEQLEKTVIDLFYKEK